MTETEPEPAIGSAEWEAQQMARSIIRQSDALDEVAKLQAVARVQPTPLVDTDLRAKMLAEARTNSGAVRMGPDRSGEAMLVAGRLMSVNRDQDGHIKQMRPGADGRVVMVRPHEWDEWDAQWRARIRLEDNLILARYWRRDRCLALGVITPDEWKELPPDPPPNPDLAPASSIESVR